MRFRPTLAIRKMHVMVGHAFQSATQLLVRFLLRLPSKVIGLADEIGTVCHDCPLPNNFGTNFVAASP